MAFCQEEGKSVFPIHTRVVADFLVALASISSSKTYPAMANKTQRTREWLLTYLNVQRKLFSKEILKSQPISSEDVARANLQ